MLCEADTFSEGLFLLLSAYYVFHLSYPDRFKNTMFFMQDYLLGMPDNYQPRKGAYLAIASDIKRCL